MKHFSMFAAKESLRATINAIEAPAQEYIDWEAFEKELDECMAKDPEPSHVKEVFAHAVTRARQTYHAFVRAGRHFIQ